MIPEAAAYRAAAAEYLRAEAARATAGLALAVAVTGRDPAAIRRAHAQVCHTAGQLAGAARDLGWAEWALRAACKEVRL